MSGVREILKEEEARLKRELADVRAALQMLSVGPQTPKREFSGVTDKAAREVANYLKDANGDVKTPEDISEALSKSHTWAREAARKATTIFPEVVRFKNTNRKFVYKWKDVDLGA